MTAYELSPGTFRFSSRKDMLMHTPARPAPFVVHPPVPLPAGLVTGPALPGMTAAAVAALQDTAARFLDRHPAPPGTRAAVATALAGLARPAPPGAAGLSTGRRDDYRKVQRTHFMVLAARD
jgi:hypothetical protein